MKSLKNLAIVAIDFAGYAAIAVLILTLSILICSPGCATNPETGERETIETREVVRLANLGLIVYAASEDGFSDAELELISTRAAEIVEDLPIREDVKRHLTVLNALVDGNTRVLAAAIEGEDWALLGSVLVDEYLEATDPPDEGD